MRHVRGLTHKRVTIPALITPHGTVSDPLLKAIEFNNYFSSVFTKDNGAFFHPEGSSAGNTLIPELSFSVVDVFEKLNNLEDKCSSGPDNIPEFSTKSFRMFFALPLFLIYKKSLALGKVPELWKTAHVTPVFKKGKRSNPAN